MGWLLVWMQTEDYKKEVKIIVSSFQALTCQKMKLRLLLLLEEWQMQKSKARISQLKTKLMVSQYSLLSTWMCGIFFPINIWTSLLFENILLGFTSYYYFSWLIQRNTPALKKQNNNPDLYLSVITSEKQIMIDQFLAEIMTHSPEVFRCRCSYEKCAIWYSHKTNMTFTGSFFFFFNVEISLNLQISLAECHLLVRKAVFMCLFMGHHVKRRL